MSGILDSREFLMSCLREALGNSAKRELLLDVCDICEMRGVASSARGLASCELTVPALAEHLFLMEDETAALLEVCKRKVSEYFQQSKSAVRAAFIQACNFEFDGLQPAGVTAF